MQKQPEKVHRSRYPLDEVNLCFLSVFVNESGELLSISFDVEAADDYHYQVKAAELPKLCEYLCCLNNKSAIATAFKERLKTWRNPIEIATLLQAAGVEYSCLHYH